jgi:hypothetical protein
MNMSHGQTRMSTDKEEIEMAVGKEALALENDLRMLRMNVRKLREMCKVVLAVQEDGMIGYLEPSIWTALRECVAAVEKE